MQKYRPFQYYPSILVVNFVKRKHKDYCKRHCKIQKLLFGTKLIPNLCNYDF